MKKLVFSMLIVCSTSIVKSQTVVVVDNVDGTSTFQNSIDLSGFSSNINDNTNWVSPDQAKRERAILEARAVEAYRSRQINALNSKIDEVDEQINGICRTIASLKQALISEQSELPTLISNIKLQKDKVKRDFMKKMAIGTTLFPESIMNEYDNASDSKKALMIYSVATNPLNFIAGRSLLYALNYLDFLINLKDYLFEYDKKIEDLDRSQRHLQSRLDDLNHYIAGTWTYQPIKDQQNLIDVLNVEKATCLDKIKWWEDAHIIFDESMITLDLYIGLTEDGGNGGQVQRVKSGL